MRAWLGKPAGRFGAVILTLAAVGCGNELGICFFPEQEESEETTLEECTERGGTWQAIEESIVGV